MYEATQYVEPDFKVGQVYRGPQETMIGAYASETAAIAQARSLWREFREGRPNDVAWWIVRRRGEDLARWIADSRSDVERVLDLRTMKLVEVPSPAR